MTSNRDQEFLHDFKAHRFYHATSLEAAESIATNGFRVWIEDDDIGRYASGGNLGNGIYVTCNWRIALWFGTTLLEVGLAPNTRILNAALPPDQTVIAYLQREFGREILSQTPRKAIPKNKQLRRNELVNLFRYHYRQTWEKDYGRDSDGSPRWPKRRGRHAGLLGEFRTQLIRYGFDGYGNPFDDNGIVIFAEDRVLLKELIGVIPAQDVPALPPQDQQEFETINQVREYFYRRGSKHAKELANRIAARHPVKQRR